MQKKSGGEEKRKWFGTKKGRKGKVVGEQGFAAAPSLGVAGGGGAGSAYLENSRMLNERWGAPRPVEKEKDGKCVVM